MQAAPTSGLVSEASANSVSGADRLVTAALAHTGVALGEHAAGVDDDRRDGRHQTAGHPAVDRCERLLHSGHRNGWRRFRDVSRTGALGKYRSR